MKIILLSAFALAGCAEAAPSEPAAPPDLGVPADLDIAHPQSDLAFSPDLEPPYYACVTRMQAPVTSGSPQAQMCLTSEVCVDSLGHTRTVALHDSCHGISCQWKLACNGGNPKVFCLPDNEQSSPEYADDACTVPIALVALLQNGQPATQYVGIDNYDRPDGGFDDGGANYCVDEYATGKAWTGDTFYAFYGGGCNPTFFIFPGIKLYYLSGPIDPNALFVEQ